MHIIRGIGVSNGKGSGKLRCIENNADNVKKTLASNIDDELEKYQKARADAMNQLQSLYEKALVKVGENDAKIFVIQQMMIHENGFTSTIRNMIKDEGVTAQYAVFTVANTHMEMLEGTNDEYMQARTADVYDVSQRVIRNLNKRKGFTPPRGKNIVLYKYLITPSEMIELDCQNIAAALTFKDSKYSHASILARTMKLPRVTDIPEDIYKYDGKKVTVDADSGEISIHITK